LKSSRQRRAGIVGARLLTQVVQKVRAGLLYGVLVSTDRRRRKRCERFCWKVAGWGLRHMCRISGDNLAPGPCGAKELREEALTVLIVRIERRGGGENPQPRVSGTQPETV